MSWFTLPRMLSKSATTTAKSKRKQNKAGRLALEALLAGALAGEAPANRGPGSSRPDRYLRF